MRAALSGLILTLAVFAGVRLATADPGGPASPNELTYSGVLRNRAGTGPLVGDVTLVFTLRRADGSSCPPVTVTSMANASGAFSAPVSTRLCPSGFFNGDQVSYDVSLILPSTEAGALTPEGGVAITPVPYARFADQVGVNNDCPAGYQRETSDPAFMPEMRLCQKTRPDGRGGVAIIDEVVRVGTGASAFWIDRYEATVWPDAAASGIPLFRSDGDFPTTAFPRNGQWRFPSHGPPSAYAHSVRGYVPAASITWFQAQEACRAYGKRLPTGEEWLAAANGTVDPGSNNGLALPSNTACSTMAAGPRMTGGGSTCVSGWGAQDMIGNVWEWTSEWHASSGQVTSAPTFDYRMVTGSRANDQATPWPSEYHDDRTWNITSVASRSPLAGDDNRVGMPSAEVRGGDWNFGTRAGIFAMILASGPSGWDSTFGFRCVIPR